MTTEELGISEVSRLIRHRKFRRGLLPSYEWYSFRGEEASHPRSLILWRHNRRTNVGVIKLTIKQTLLIISMIPVYALHGRPPMNHIGHNSPILFGQVKLCDKRAKNTNQSWNTINCSSCGQDMNQNRLVEIETTRKIKINHQIREALLRLTHPVLTNHPVDRKKLTARKVVENKSSKAHAEQPHPLLSLACCLCPLYPKPTPPISKHTSPSR